MRREENPFNAASRFLVYRQMYLIQHDFFNRKSEQPQILKDANNDALRKLKLYRSQRKKEKKGNTTNSTNTGGSEIQPPQSTNTEDIADNEKLAIFAKELELDKYESRNKRNGEIAAEQRQAADGGLLDVAQARIKRRDGDVSSALQQGVQSKEDKDKRNREDEAIIEELAKEQGQWIDEVDQYLEEKYGEKIDSGSESYVYRKDKDTVIKSRTIDPFVEGGYNSIQRALDSIAIHNLLFPETAMKVVGFGRSDGELTVILEQPYIEGRYATDDEIAEYVDKLYGAEKDISIIGGTSYKTATYLLQDLKSKNVKVGVVNGKKQLYIIDGDFYYTRKHRQYLKLKEKVQSKGITPQQNAARSALGAYYRWQKEHITKSEKFNEDHTYLLDDNPIADSVTQFWRKLFPEKIDGDHTYASSIGNSVDAIVRDYFKRNNPENTMYPNMTADRRDAIIEDCKRLERELKSRYGENAIIITEEFVLTGNVKAKGLAERVAGTMDMLVIDEAGDLHILDMKAKKGSIDSYNNRRNYTLQLNAYKELLEQCVPAFKGRVKSIDLIWFGQDYPTQGKGVTYTTDTNSGEITVTSGSYTVPMSEYSKWSTPSLSDNWDDALINLDIKPVFDEVTPVWETPKPKEEKSKDTPPSAGSHIDIHKDNPRLKLLKAFTHQQREYRVEMLAWDKFN